MAIYKNREVRIIAPVAVASHPNTIKVQHLDGLQDDVAIGQVRFTEDEKKDLVKRYPSQFDNVQTVSEDDLKAVRIGVAPSFDPSMKEQADAKARHEMQVKVSQDQQKRVTDEAKAKLDRQVNAPMVANASRR